MGTSTMKVNIDRLTLDGFDLNARQQRALQRSLESELGSLLGGRFMPGRLTSGSLVDQLPGGPLELGPWSSPESLGQRLARTIVEGLDR